MLFTFCCLLSSFLSISPVYAQLSGTYTNGGADGSYTNFTEAATALQAQGVSGPVTFKVRPGTYEEQLKLTEIRGASCGQTIVFEGENMDRTAVVITSRGPSVVIDGTDGILSVI